jgi:hypothetical protein
MMKNTLEQLTEIIVGLAGDADTIIESGLVFRQLGWYRG